MQEYVCACTYVHVCCMAKLWDERTNSHLMVHKSIFDNSRGSSINMWLQTQRAGTWAPGAGKGLLWEQGQEEAEGPGQWTLILQDSGYIFDCKICTYITVGGGGGQKAPDDDFKIPMWPIFSLRVWRNGHILHHPPKHCPLSCQWGHKITCTVWETDLLCPQLVMDVTSV